ncbi:hypothetical protein D3C72_1779780 [compost metagenome]
MLLERHAGRLKDLADTRHRLVAGLLVPVVDGFLADKGAHLAAHFRGHMHDMHGKAGLQQLAFGDKARRGVAEGGAVGGEHDIGHDGNLLDGGCRTSQVEEHRRVGGDR